MKKFLLFMLAGLFLIISATGCNTLEGMGRDVKNAGSSMEGAGSN
ncbi:MAG: entericidin [Candidatus Omnitrophica bacterium]|nr:entericidin [Candidatus Omnitrophota bacterium]